MLRKPVVDFILFNKNDFKVQHFEDHEYIERAAQQDMALKSGTSPKHLSILSFFFFERRRIFTLQQDNARLQKKQPTPT